MDPLRKNALKVFLFSIVFFLLTYAYHFSLVLPSEVERSIIRSGAFTGATLIALALLAGPTVRVFQKVNFVRYRKTLGIMGFIFAIIHALSVINTYYNWDLGKTLPGSDPFTFPVVFGTIAFIIFLPVFITSNNLSTRKLGPRKWKAIHRLVYIAFIILVLHFILINTEAMATVSGYLLLLVTALVFIFELTAFIQYRKTKKGAVIGTIIFLFGLAMFYLAATVQSQFAMLLVATTIIGTVILLGIKKVRR